MKTLHDFSDELRLIISDKIINHPNPNLYYDEEKTVSKHTFSIISENENFTIEIDNLFVQLLNKLEFCFVQSSYTKDEKYINSIKGYATLLDKFTGDSESCVIFIKELNDIVHVTLTENEDGIHFKITTLD